MNSLLLIWILIFGQQTNVQVTQTTEWENVLGARYREFGKEDFCMAYAIFRSESGLRPDREGDSGSSIGISQIHIPAHSKKIPADTEEGKKEWLKNFQNNLKLAKEIKDKSGWYPWSVYKNGKYLAFYNPSCLDKNE